MIVRWKVSNVTISSFTYVLSEIYCFIYFVCYLYLQEIIPSDWAQRLSKENKKTRIFGTFIFISTVSSLRKLRSSIERWKKLGSLAPLQAG